MKFERNMNIESNHAKMKTLLILKIRSSFGFCVTKMESILM
jgi:hypothetical protein